MTTVQLRNGLLSYTLASKPGGVYNNPAKPLVSTLAVAPAYWWTSLASLPADGQVSQALLQFWTYDAMPAANRTWTAKPSPSFKASQLNFGNKPAAGASSASVDTVGALPAGTLISIDVTTIVQAMRAGTATAAGYFQLTVNDTTPRGLRGFTSGKNKPQLVVSYDTGTPAPSGIIPSGGAVGTRQPIVAWTPWAGETGQRLQVASDEAFANIVFDSAMVNVTAGQYDLTGNGSGYQLPADGSHVFLRALRNGALGPSAPSPVAETWFRALPVPVVTNPAASSGDGTPPVTATVTGGLAPYKGYRVLTRTAGTSSVLDDSGEKAGAFVGYTPLRGLTVVGASADVEVRVTDSEVRAAVRNCPVYGTASKTFTLAATGNVAPTSDLAIAFLSSGAPWATLQWSWSSLPDEWLVLRDGLEVARFTGPSVYQAGAGNHFSWTDYAAAGMTEHTWTVVPLSNGVRGLPSNAAKATARVVGLHLVDVDTGEQVMLLGRDEVEPEFPSTVSLSAPLGRGYTSVRETNLQSPTYAASGAVETAVARYGRTVEGTLAAFRAIKWSSRSRRLRFAFTTVNMPASVHSMKEQAIRAGASAAVHRYVLSYSAVGQGENPNPDGA